MNYTENLSLGLPGYGESADVAALNRNSGILDAYCYNSRQMECEPYDSTKTYMSGDLAIHNEVIYECNTDNTTGTWDDSKWDSTTLAEQIAKAKQSGGESEFADLDDVSFSNLSNGQTVKYNTTSQKWENTDFPDTAVTKEATGNPIDITDAASAPLVKCVTAITGSQDLHGYDKPWVGGAGKNKLPLVLADIKSLNTTGTWSGSSYTVNGVTFTVITDNYGNVTGIKVNGMATETIYFKLAQGLSFLGTFNGTYTATGAQNGGNDSTYAFQVYSDVGGVYINVYGAIDYSVKSDSTPTANIDSAYITIRSGYTASNLLFKPMIRLSTETDSTFAPYSNICPITAYTQGEIEVVGFNQWDEEWEAGTLNSQGQPQENTVDLRSKNFRIADGGTSYCYSLITTLTGMTRYVFWYDVNKNFISYYMFSSQTTTAPTNAKYFKIVAQSYLRNYTSYQNNICFNISDPSKNGTYEPYKGVDHTTTYPSAIYRGSEDVVNGGVTTEWGMIASYAGETLPGEWISDRDEYVPGTTPTTGAQVAYELATPTTSSVTPTNLPIRTLSGYNHIESSTGEMEVEYITEEYQPLVDLIQSSKHVYSTQEQIVGTWIDGRDLYERIIEFPNVTINGGPSDFKYKGDLMIKSIIPNADIILPDLQHSYYVVNSAQFSFLGFRVNCNTGELTVVTMFTVTNADLHIYLQYTKTPSSTRSLNAPVTSQKAQIEPLIAEEEEVPTEEEKAVNEEENNDETR